LRRRFQLRAKGQLGGVPPPNLGMSLLHHLYFSAFILEFDVNFFYANVLIRFSIYHIYNICYAKPEKKSTISNPA
jgi:hypothetical protein